MIEIISEKMGIFQDKKTLLIGSSIIGILIGVIPVQWSKVILIILLCALCIVIYTFLATSVKDRKFLIIALLVGFGLRIFLTAVLHYDSCVQGNEGFFFLDDVLYDKIGWTIAQEWKNGHFADLSLIPASVRPALGYFYFNAAVYYLFGHNLLLIKIFNCLLGVLTIVLIYKIAKFIYDRRVAMIASTLTCFFPNLIFWSCFNLKDTLLMFLMCLIVWESLKLKEGFGWYRYIIIFGSLYFLIIIRWYLAALLAILILVPFFFAIFKTKKNRKKYIFSFIIFLILLGICTGMSRYGIFGINILEGKFGTLSWYQIRMASIMSQESIFAGVTLHTPQEMIRFLPVGMAHFLLGPLIWSIEPLFWPLAIGTLMWYVLIPFVLYGILYSIKKRKVDSFPLYMVIFVSVIIFGILYLGGAARQSLQIIPFSMIFAGVAVTRFHRWKSIFFLFELVLFLGILLYFYYSQSNLIFTAIILGVMAVILAYEPLKLYFDESRKNS